jgi:hypothetical protein
MQPNQIVMGKMQGQYGDMNKVATSNLKRAVEALRSSNLKHWLSMAVVLMASPALAALGGDIYASCAGVPGTQAYALCAAYLNGFVGGVLVDQISNEQATPICLPDNMTTDQVREVIIKYAKTNPAALGVISNSFVGAALMSAFPCKKSN